MIGSQVDKQLLIEYLAGFEEQVEQGKQMQWMAIGAMQLCQHLIEKIEEGEKSPSDEVNDETN